MWIEPLDDVQKATPINLAHAECKKYMEHVAGEDTQEEEEALNMYPKIIEAVERHLVATGVSPTTISMSKDTHDKFCEEVYKYLPESAIEEEDVSISHISVTGATLWVCISNDLPYGEFVITGGSAEDEEE
jgi:hypothetical protein